MIGQALDTRIDIHDWIEIETTHIDVVASWESLCDTYDTLRFTDPLSDIERLDEFKWIVQQMNSFLTKMRTKLLSCRDLSTMIEALSSSMQPAGRMDLSARKALVYQKLRQQWIRMAIMRLQVMAQEMEMEEEDG